LSYGLDGDPVAQAQIRALPSDALVALAEVMSMLELTPWSGRPINEDNPQGNVRVSCTSASDSVERCSCRSKRMEAVECR
jgi:hypothetical protein